MHHQENLIYFLDARNSLGYGIRKQAMRYPMFERMVGAKILSIEGAEHGSDNVRIVTDAGTLTMTHYQACREYVCVEDVTGCVDDLIGAIIRVAEERDNCDDEQFKNTECDEWTFYEIRTDKGDISIRWYGSSNGYYSTSVDCEWEPVREP